MKEQLADRIGRFLAGEMDEQERRAFEQEIASDPDLNESFLAFQQIWQTKLVTPEDRWDAELGWVEFEKRNLDPVPVSLTRRIVLYWAIAASVLLLLGFTYFFILTPSPKTYLFADHQDGAIELKDGSKVYLNKGGAVTVYPFTRKARHVELSGEAYFEISHDVKRPFTIACGGTVTQVVGTAFTIRQVKDEVRLSVQTGKVIFRIEDDPHEALALISGEAADFKGHHLQMIPNPSPNVSAWHTR
ncbi:MAG TPA: FecR domain-containing protein, partial [Saprospiraceae bacterium]|nr:FecR domain-containing protein [Saprospiraceae bacterium]